ncbi:MAG: D-glucuronyl C5-epimerase family protein [Deltaproteobacteria bacterium]
MNTETRNIIHTYISLLLRWFNILLGRSYYHVSQPIGRFISKDEIAGYYNDFTKKADWKGISDNEGIPLNILSNGIKVYFPITIAQMALGNYDLWLESKESENKRKFLTLANWLKENQDSKGGWENPWEYLRPSSISNYSAMAQGEGISTLVRAYALTKDISFLNQAEKAYNLMMAPIEKGGCTFFIDEDIYLEEYPEIPRSTVLNGWIYALFGVYDFKIASKDRDVKSVYEKSLETVEKSLKFFDSGYWTYYDLQNNLASHYYHAVHISLLDALYILSDTKTFDHFSNKWKNYERNFFNKSKALTAKALQRLKNPMNITITK